MNLDIPSTVESSPLTPRQTGFSVSLVPSVLSFPSAPKLLFISPKSSLCPLFSWNSCCQGPISTTQWLINKESFLSRRKFYCSGIQWTAFVPVSRMCEMRRLILDRIWHFPWLCRRACAFSEEVMSQIPHLAFWSVEVRFGAFKGPAGTLSPSPSSWPGLGKVQGKW